MDQDELRRAEEIFADLAPRSYNLDLRELTSERYEYLRGEQERQTPPPRLFWGDPTQPALPPQGVLPGTPGADPTPPLLGGKPPALPEANPAPPPARP